VSSLLLILEKTFIETARTVLISVRKIKFVGSTSSCEMSKEGFIRDCEILQFPGKKIVCLCLFLEIDAGLKLPLKLLDSKSV